VRVEWVDSHARFAELGPPWREITGERALPYLRHSWFDAWARAFIDRDTIETPVGWEGDRMLGCLPAMRAGRNLRGMVNWETPLFSPIAAEARYAECVVREAIERCRAVLSIDAVEANGDGERAIQRMARESGCKTLVRHWQISPVIDTSGTFEEYRDRTRPQWLKRLARYRRKMAREMALELSVAEIPTRPGAALDECLRLEAAGWKGQAGTAILSSPAMERFYRDVFAMLLESGELRLSLLRLNGRLAAFDLAFAHENRLYSLKTGFDETVKKVVPGLVLRLSLVEHCFNHGLSAHELLGGDLPWKRNFATGRRAHMRFRCYRSTVAGRAAYFTDAHARPALGRLYRGARPRARSDETDGSPPGDETAETS
jgi:CelD/BcsL family acetyltransferase involved in cellulose biosynthesis